MPLPSLRLASPALLREVMRRRGCTLADVAEAAGCHRSMISHLLAGRSPGLRTDRAERIAAALAVPVDLLWITEGEDPPP